MDTKRRLFIVLFLILAVCLIMAWIDAVISPIYPIKSAAKIGLFLIIPIGYSFLDKSISLRSFFLLDRKKFFISIFLGLGIYLFILGAYFIIGPFFDFSNITITLQNNIGVNKTNFIYVALYISFINSLLEEFFFRGFGFLTLKKFTSRKVAYIFSAGVFSLYHIAIMTSWFTPILFILLIFSLFVAGLLFNWLNEKSNNIYTSWMVHLFANLAINTIGFILFGIL